MAHRLGIARENMVGCIQDNSVVDRSGMGRCLDITLKELAAAFWQNLYKCY